MTTSVLTSVDDDVVIEIALNKILAHETFTLINREHIVQLVQNNLEDFGTIPRNDVHYILYLHLREAYFFYFNVYNVCEGNGFNYFWHLFPLYMENTNNILNDNNLSNPYGHFNFVLPFTFGSDFYCLFVFKQKETMFIINYDCPNDVKDDVKVRVKAYIMTSIVPEFPNIQSEKPYDLVFLQGDASSPVHINYAAEIANFLNTEEVGGNMDEASNRRIFANNYFFKILMCCLHVGITYYQNKTINTNNINLDFFLLNSLEDIGDIFKYLKMQFS